MPSRKSNVSAVSNGGDEVVDTTPARAVKDKDGLSVDDLSLPKSMIARLAKGVLPANTQIHKDALLALHKSATVFVSYIASNSNDNAQAAGKKTISPLDVIAALKDAEFEGFVPRLEAELKKYNDIQSDKRNNYRKKVKGEKSNTTTTNDESEIQTDADVSVLAEKSNGNGVDAEGSRPAKKLRRANGDASVAEDNETDGDDEDEGQDADENAEDDDEEDDEAAEDAEEADEDEEEEDETMEDSQDDEDPDARPRNELQDEALDDPDSD
ncbi:histone-fold-containing protein [Dissoconium aciculare CBS 342.82]|uniref:DNA polymerase epsilon subunit D n=1 Tax=Dissoconium aciculare CBS 342.82 TaxID=1314786 RepID=A0A6J3MED1_9PEZI|nr:histone-fold-containing protein [Dissoconium aciculare CBS 342.82]KAF1825969.1 histone-fold-containing protein [Dissoconium aciculare CBS 342.82]